MTLDRLWTAVATKDRSADGLFVYAVRSTGVYCRPSCPSRRPRPDRVEFFPAPIMAEEHGYRPCRRCKPSAPATGPASLDRVRRACEAVARHPAEPWSAGEVARAGGASRAQLQRAFRTLLGLSPRDYVAACRRRQFLQTLRNGHSVTEAIYEAGYGSPSRMYDAIRLPGMTPATYGRGGQGAHIRWTVTDASIGRIMVAATERGLCFVQIGREDRELLGVLRAEFPAARIDAHPSADLDALAAGARAVAEAKSIPTELPVDIRGTAFQWRVWRALTQIPRGQTRTYSEIARSIGQPAAVRAVARACATNPLSLVVPCHRVIGKNGQLSGYRWGLEVKQALIERESARGRRAGHNG